MKNNKETPRDKRELRRLAEAQFHAQRYAFLPEGGITPIQMQRQLHELQVHQIELELQNEELRRTRAEVEEGLARYAELYDFAPVGYLTLGRDGSIQQLNLAAARSLGLERSRLLGMRLSEVIAAESRNTLAAFVANVFASQAKESCEVLLGSRGGTATTVELAGTISQDRQACRVVLADVSTRVRAEHERLELQERREQAQKMEAIGTLAGGMAHDFNNIFAGILGNLSLLELDFSPAGNVRAEIKDMKELVNCGTDLTKQLLGFAGCGRYNVKPLDLARVAAKTSAIFGRTHDDISIYLDLARDLPGVLMDRSQLDQVLLNLLVNASQAMPQGGQLRLRAECAKLTQAEVTTYGASPGAFVKLMITDTGIGMDAATQARIFEPFFTTKRPGQGTGLGLATVYGILRKHGGFITVESVPGRGSTFTLFLPATDGPAPEEKTPMVAIQHGVGKILVVDDEATVRSVCARMLQRIGYEVLTASTGQEAIDIVREHGPSIGLIILDLIMPDMSGIQTYDAVQKLTPGIKVLLSSGLGVEELGRNILDRGWTGLLQKPFDVAVLSSEVRKALTRADA